MSTCHLMGFAPLSAPPLRLRLAIKVRAGQSHFPSPAQDYEQRDLDLHEAFIKNPPATFIFKVAGDSMIGAGIFPGSTLLVDRSIAPVSGQVVIVDIDGEWMVKRLQRRDGWLRLLSENPAHPPIIINEGQELTIFGVVTYVIHPPE